MNLGKTLFAQLMEFVPWTSFARIVARYSGDARVSALPSTEHFRIMAYAQLTWRESLRDVEATLGANATKLYAMGLRQAVRRSTLADANERRDWRIWADFAAVLIRRANKLYATEPLGLDVNIAGNVYALDSSTIDLCLSLFDWAPYRTAEAAIKLHTLLDLRGNIPSFLHISDGKMGDVNVLDILPMEAGAFYIMDRGYVDFTRLYAMHQRGAFCVTRAKSNLDARRVYSAKVEKATGVVCDQTMALTLTLADLGRVGCRNQGGIDHRSGLEQQASLGQRGVDGGQQLDARVVLLEQMAKSQNRGFIGQPTQTRIQSSKLAIQRHVVQGFFHRRITQSKPLLHEMNAQHGRHCKWRTARVAFRCVRFNHANQLGPRHHQPSSSHQEIRACASSCARVQIR